eukprot:703184-Pelagomonas_calceolata.AAC.3
MLHTELRMRFEHTALHGHSPPVLVTPPLWQGTATRSARRVRLLHAPCRHLPPVPVTPPLWQTTAPLQRPHPVPKQHLWAAAWRVFEGRHGSFAMRTWGFQHVPFEARAYGASACLCVLADVQQSED